MYYPNLADRVSFRLTFAALFCDIGYSGHLLVILGWNNTPGFFCGYTVWAIVFFGLSSLFFIVCIALNLHIIFINEYKSRYNFEKYYFITAFSFALLLSLLPVIANMSCWYRDSGQEYNIIWQWVTLFGWIDVSILYCAIVVIMVIRKLRYVTKKVDDVFDSFPTTQLSGYPALINKTVIFSVVRRVMWYPVVPLIAQFLFSQDIAVTRAYQAIKLQWWISNVNAYESLYPHRSYNKAIIDDIGILQPSLLEWLRYMLLIKLFSVPKISPRLMSLELLSPVNSITGNKPNTSSALFGKNDLKQDITPPNNQNDDQDIHLVLPEPVHLKNSFQYSSLDLISHSLNPSTSSDPLIVLINMPVNDEQTKRLSDDYLKIYGQDTELSQEIEIVKLILKRL
ncbi:964_t:CDS:2 [Dentiscutata erythropus]|uniref:964_t:CDS:1 n=1 Tax=Dentiscutata erythropus TaxID=1348616 RepID=A0A9N9AL61_9GLOM|nr:964_t:CDS:2 [Dentiscutata erythropus]